MLYDEIIEWLLIGDVSIQYQVYRDLLGLEKFDLRKKIESEGWGKQFLSYRKDDGYWGNGFYNPKWRSSHYTLLDLKYLNIFPDNRPIKETINKIFEKGKGQDGGLNPSATLKQSDVCINAMAINYASYFRIKEDHLKSVIDFILEEKMNDGGFNCQSNRRKVYHSSLHTTLSVLEGFYEYEKNGYTYRIGEIKEVRNSSHEFILMHRLYKSDKTGEIIKPAFLKLCYPGRWYYDILKAMDYFSLANVMYDRRMNDAMEVLNKRKTKEGLWKLPSHHAGEVHFKMEEVGKPSRWNTLRALRVLKKYDDEVKKK